MTGEPVCTQTDGDECATSTHPSLGRCPDCGYVFHDIPRSTDDAHDELCGLDYDAASDPTVRYVSDGPCRTHRIVACPCVGPIAAND